MIAVHHSADRRPPRSAGWRGTFVTGLLLWIASVLVTGLTDNVNMIPTVILLGSFLVPATAVIWYLDHYHSDVVTPAVAARAFIVGGVFGVLAASVLESLLSGRGLLLFFGVGLIEELAKLLGLLLIARRLSRYGVRDGIVLGAAVGFGFAALESSGYALSSLFVREGRTIVLSLGGLVSTEVLRGMLAPVGHGLWTAILGGVLFAASRNGRLRITAGLVGTYVLVAILHGFWDSMGPIAELLTAVSLAVLPRFGDILLGIVVPPAAEAFVLNLAFYFGGLIVLSLIGIGLLRWRWKSGGRRAPAGRPVLQAA
jgi:protease PrsW